MIIDQEELTKLCKYLYLKFFDYKDIVLNDFLKSVELKNGHVCIELK